MFYLFTYFILLPRPIWPTLNVPSPPPKILSLVVQGFVWPTYVHLQGCKSAWGNITQLLTAGCMEPIPPSRGSIDNFQSAAEGATITYSCSPGLVPRTQMSAVCTNLIWRPDPATLQCREPCEYCMWLFEFPIALQLVSDVIICA